jgi:hypothetical protein
MVPLIKEAIIYMTKELKEKLINKEAICTKDYVMKFMGYMMSKHNLGIHVEE